MQSVPLLIAVVALLGVASPVPAALSETASPAEITRETVLAARAVMMDDPAAALALGVALETRAGNVREQSARQIMLARAKWIEGEASLRLKRVDETRRLIEASYALSVASRNPQAEGDALLSRGAIKDQSGDPAGALQDYLTANERFRRTADARSQAITLQNLSQLYADAQDLTKAEFYLRQSAETYHGEPMIQLALANNMGNLLAEQGRYSDAEKAFHDGLSIARKLEVHALELHLLGNLTQAQIKQGQLAKASRTANEMNEVARRTGTAINDTQRATMARLAFAQGRVQLARRIIGEILAPAGRKAPVLDQDLHNTAYEIFKAAGDARLALAQLEIASRLRNQAAAVGTSNKAALMAARFDFETQDLRIAALKSKVLERDMALEHEAKSQERTIFGSLGLLVLIIVTLLSIWLAALRRSRDRFRTVSEQLEQSNSSLEAAFREVGESARAEQEATQLALHDALTGLPNRRQLNEVFEASVEEEIDLDRAVFILLLDLDRFKPINDIHGHEVGDAVLMATADRLKTLCSQSAAKVFRLGGDEFVVVMAGADGTAAEQLADAVIQEIRLPIYVGERRLALGASIGISRYPKDGMTIEKLLRAADAAMYEAKRSGKDRWCFFDQAMATRKRMRAI